MIVRTSPELVQVHILSFEGPDAYARAGGVASRVTGLADALGSAGFEVHLWFIGDPSWPGREPRGTVQLHRWCQWISGYHPAGVYDGEVGKVSDYASSLPPVLMNETLLPWLRLAGRKAIILAEEWHTADAMLHLDSLLRSVGLRDRVTMFWNANNVFGFDQVPWERLRLAATITTVSRYMRYRMRGLGLDPLVLPNGLGGDAFHVPDERVTADFRRRTWDRLVITKVARWDPDKGWLLAVDTVCELKRQGRRPLLIARGGVESYGGEVMAHAVSAGLAVAERRLPSGGSEGLLRALEQLDGIDVLSLTSPLEPQACRLLFRGAAAVLANSASEPFGLVGLETMAMGGIACTGGTGEDYAVPGWNGLVLQTPDPRELGRFLDWLRAYPQDERILRANARRTAQRYIWSEIIRRNFSPLLGISPAAPGLRPTADSDFETVISQVMNRSSRSASARQRKRAHRRLLVGPGAER